MDLQHLKQWQKHQQKHESDQQSDLTRLLLNDCYYKQHHSNCSELPLFTSPDQSSTKLDLHSPPLVSSSSYFSMAQWQELEVQACIYRHMIAGAPVPPQLLHLVKKSLILNSHSSSPPYYHSSPYHTALLQSGGYWGRGGMDPEPGRCRRTDGKKWRCSRDVVGGYKYCERHMHRGRNRSRKPVEIPTPPLTAIEANDNANQLFAAQLPTATPFRLTGPSHSFDLIPLNHKPCETVNETKGSYRIPKSELLEKDKSSSTQVLRPFFDDWPRSVQEAESLGASLSISVPGNPSSDVSLKLNTGGARDNPRPEGNVRREQPHLQWGSSTSPWETNHMGGPLAEALRSSKPTSVLPQQHGAENYTST